MSLVLGSSPAIQFVTTSVKVSLLINGEWEKEFLCKDINPSFMVLAIYLPDNSFITVVLNIVEDIISLRLCSVLNVPGVDVAADGHLFLKVGSDLNWIHYHWEDTGIYEVRFPSKQDREVMQQEHISTGLFLVEPGFLL